MAITVQAFARQCSEVLEADAGPAGRERVCELLEQALRDPAFIEAAVPETTGDRELLYRHPTLGFCIFAEHKSGAKTGEPHDHGPSWAIYGQAAGITRMSEWQVVEPAGPDKPGKVRRAKQYAMEPGTAYVYDEGVLHSPSRDAPTRLIRFEGMDLSALRAGRPKYDIVD